MDAPRLSRSARAVLVGCLAGAAACARPGPTPDVSVSTAELIHLHDNDLAIHLVTGPAHPHGPLVLYTGRLVAEKGIEVLAEAWPRITRPATLVLAGDGPYAEWMRSVPGTRLLGPVARAQLVVAYAAAQFTVVPSIPTPRFKEPWGLVCNEAFEQGRTVIATTAVGAAAGGLVRDGQTGLVIAPNDAPQLARAIDALLRDEPLRSRLSTTARVAVQPYTYEAMAAGVEAALTAAAGATWRSR